MRVFRQNLFARRRGFTLAELLVVVGISSIICTALVSLILTTYRTWGQEMRQNEMDWRCRLILNSFTTDCEAAYAVVYTSNGTWTLPSGVTFNVPASFGTGVTASTRLAVLQLPSFDSQGTIPNTWDYICYNWNQTTRIITRTVIPTAGSSRKYSSGILPGGGEFDTWMDVYVHLASSNTWADPFPPNATQDLTDADALLFDITVAGTSWGQSVKLELQSNATFRNYDSPSSTSSTGTTGATTTSSSTGTTGTTSATSTTGTTSATTTTGTTSATSTTGTTATTGGTTTTGTTSATTGSTSATTTTGTTGTAGATGNTSSGSTSSRTTGTTGTHGGHNSGH